MGCGCVLQTARGADAQRPPVSTRQTASSTRSVSIFVISYLGTAQPRRANFLIHISFSMTSRFDHAYDFRRIFVKLFKIASGIRRAGSTRAYQTGSCQKWDSPLGLYVCFAFIRDRSRSRSPSSRYKRRDEERGTSSRPRDERRERTRDDEREPASKPREETKPRERKSRYIHLIC